MAIAPPRRIMEEDLLQVPEDGYSYELVEGVLKRVPTQFAHDLIKMLLLSRLLPVAMPLGFLTGGEAGVRMRSGNVRVPDVSFTRRERIHEMLPQPGFGMVAPDLCVEIISDTEDPHDAQRKVQEYFESGAERVWQFLPAIQQIKDFSSADAFRILGADEYLEGGDLLPGFRVRVGELFDLGLD